jgi:glycosyltransferase involved in cell wall biosynthesis
MKIAFIGQKGIPATYGGIERFTEEVASRLAQLGHEVTVYVRPHYLKSAMDEYGDTLNWMGKNTFLWKGARGKVVYSYHSKHLDALSHSALCAVQALFEDYDAIVYQAIGPSCLSFISRLFSKALVATIIHSLDWQRSKWGLVAKIIFRCSEPAAIVFPQVVCAVSPSLQEYIRAKYGRQAVVLTPGIGIKPGGHGEGIRDLGLEPQQYILFLNRIVPEKGCHYLLEAFNRLATDKILVIAGDSSQDPGYYEALKSHYSGERIRFLGYVESSMVPDLYANALLYVLPSEVEGLSQTLLEAAAYGCPILASDIEENTKLLGQMGAYFEKGNVKDLAEKLEKIIRDGYPFINQVDILRQYVKDNFSWEHTCSTLIDAINSVKK